MDHTPTPWKTARWDLREARIAGIQIAVTDDGGRHALALTGIEGASDEAESRANAALIVRAVNCHADLLAALKDLHAHTSRHGTGAQGWNAILNKAEAAIAKAEETP